MKTLAEYIGKCAGGCGASIVYRLTDEGSGYAPELHAVGCPRAFSGGHLCGPCTIAVLDALHARCSVLRLAAAEGA
jgi:hypothetical protein